jgi:hypothetical protein
MLKINSDFDPRINVTILVYERSAEGPRLVDKRETHNVMTDTGRAWLVQRLGSSNYANAEPTPNTTEVIKYVGLGVGGALQSTPGYAHAQAELAQVTALEDPVCFEKVGSVQTYLKTVKNQTTESTFFPGVGRTVFIYDVPESLVSFETNTSFGGQTVGTSVPVSEAGLYLSLANTTYDTNNPLVDQPTAPNRLACYNIFDPIVVTPNVMLRILWEIRVGG